MLSTSIFMMFLSINKSLTTDVYRAIGESISGILICYVAICSHSVHSVKWKLLKIQLERFEQLFYALKYQSRRIMSKVFIVVLIWAWHGLIGISLICIPIRTWQEKTIFYTANFYISVVSTNIFIMNDMLSERYMFICSKLKELTEFPCMTRSKLKLIIRFMKATDEMVDTLNIIFGWPMLFCVNSTVVEVVIETFYLITLKRTVGTLILSSFITGWKIVVLVIMVMSCNAVEECGKNVVQACYKLHHKTANKKMKSQILLLATYAEEWRPVFSAAGFYDVNQKCLNSIFSASINYLVIIIQFNMMVSIPKNT
ncbi:unnamed protein product [Phaedon cochleariae]|uniref:Gustatory receptor n=1 Tax=Phaedon cochleariae TaxID=80249 RepID=A0A9P0DL42_PHACE|nr:unnamed protein product [Phaedon cochleariae]